MIIYPTELDIKIFGKDAHNKFKAVVDNTLPGVIELNSNDIYNTEEYAIFSGYGNCSIENTFFDKDLPFSEVAMKLESDIIALGFREVDDIYCLYKFSKDGEVTKLVSKSITEEIDKNYSQMEDAIVALEDDVFIDLLLAP